MADDPLLVRRATPEERADVGRMHRANRAAWDEAAERYEGWFDEAVELIRSGGTNLFGVETELIGDLHGRCRRAIHLQCAGGRDTLSLWNHGADEVVGIDFSPRMLDLAGRLTAATGAPARWILSDVLDAPAELDGTADLVYTGRGSLIWLGDLDALGRRHRPAPVARRSIRAVRRPPGGVAVRRRRRWPLGRHGLRLLRWRGGVARLGAGVHRSAVHRRARPELEVRPGVDARRDRHGAARRRICASRPSPSTRSTGGAVMATCGQRNEAGSRCRSPSPGERVPPDVQPVTSPSRVRRPSEARSTTLTTTIAARAIGP